MTTTNESARETKSAEVEIEVPGTPEEVWRAIATGPGITSWFTRSEVEERKGGRAVSHFGAMGNSVGEVTVWDPPRRSVVETRDPGGPPLAIETTVEPRSGGKCLVRLVTSLFSSREDWDDQLESMEKGWKTFLYILRLYLTHFPGQPSSTIDAMGIAPMPEQSAWDAIRKSLGLADAVGGSLVQTTAPGAPRLAGKVDRAGDRELILLLDEPAPGVGLFSAFQISDQSCVFFRGYLYGPKAAAIAAREEPAWLAWVEKNFPFAQPRTPIEG
jgi:uncharacterized protein YndB with AHSA1/START domain